jgi:plastocyanin
MTTDDTETTRERVEEQTTDIPADESKATIATAADAERAAQHPYRERFVVPFVFPILIVVGVVFFVLNVSRLFLANKGSAAVILAATITVVILFGAALLASAPNLRTSSISLIVIGGLVVILGSGWLTIGHSEEKKAAVPVLGPPVGSATIEALPALKFNPNKVTVPFDTAHPTQTVISISLKDQSAGQHTLAFDDPTVVWTIPEVNNANEVKTEKAGFPKAGDYEYHCTIPGHRQAGMEGTLTVSTALKPKAGAATSGAGGGATTTSAP